MVKNVIKYVLSKFGFLLIRDVPGHVLTWRCSHPDNIEALELAILLCRKGRSSLRLIQIGANDGVVADPLRPLIQKYHLQGLLVEPLPDIYQKLRENYASEPQLTFANVAIGPSDSEINIYRFSKEATKGNDALHGLSTFDRKRIETHARNLGLSWSEIETVSVPCLSMQELVNKYRYEQFDFLCIDAEGMDFTILRSAFDSNIKPAIVYMEVLDMRPQDRQCLLDLLSKEGYKINATISDLLAVKLGSIALA